MIIVPDFIFILLGYLGGDLINTKNTAYRQYLTEKISYELESEEFRCRSRNGSQKVFTRDRKISFKGLIVLIINFKSSIQLQLDRFFKEVTKSDFNIRAATKGAFTQARAKLNPWAFQRLNEITVETFYQDAEFYVWHDMRVLAIDGSRLMLPNSSDIIEEFGQQSFGPKANSPRSLALVSMLYDVLNHLAIDGQIAPYASSERTLLMEHLCKVNSGDLLLLDRGYPCFWLLFLLKAKGIEFCVRLKEDWWLKVKSFIESDCTEQEVSFTLPKKDWGKLKDYPEIRETNIICRLIKVELPNGVKEVLCTSLTDKDIYKHEEFEGLYHYRWNEEEAFKLLKSRIELENFSGKTALSIKQDFYAKVFLLSLCAVYAHPIEQRVRQEFKAGKDRKYDQKVNRTNALATTQDILIGMFFRKQIVKALDAFDKLVYNTREIIRPGRSFKRNHRPKKPYSMIYKRL